ncbi:unnamed protein product [Callosobruchus maculatus]|uniref:Uncharacterized protein n=1 Tax=Callosobruchus maculatus TaxID=64391 RepID=A0A653BYE9_CALMS|nr:unnamed protein product [Callosobruchus maculatus]
MTLSSWRPTKWRRVVSCTCPFRLSTCQRLPRGQSYQRSSVDSRGYRCRTSSGGFRALRCPVEPKKS